MITSMQNPFVIHEYGKSQRTSSIQKRLMVIDHPTSGDGSKNKYINRYTYHLAQYRAIINMGKAYKSISKLASGRVCQVHTINIGMLGKAKEKVSTSQK